MTPEATASSRQQYDALATTLSSRKSTLHFAHASVALVAVIILSGTAGRIFYKADAEDLPFGWAAGLLAAGLLIYGVVRLVRGRSLLASELADFARLQALRLELGLDDPARLMPR